MYESQKKYRERNLKENRCPICGKRRTKHYYCEKHNAQHVARMKAQRAKSKGG